MSVEIEFPLEFVVEGTPVSLQAKRPESREAWKAKVKAASYTVLPEGHFSAGVPMSITLFYFPPAPMQGDVDNIVKPVLDALRGHVYHDDSQVERVWVQKFEPGRVFQFTNPTKALTAAILGGKPILYVRVTDDPTEGLS